MKCEFRIIAILLGILTGMPSTVFSRVRVDSLVMNRIFNYQRNFTQSIEGKQQNVYMKTRLYINKRNSLLWLVPHMYSVAEGSHTFIDESYGRLTFQGINDFNIRRQVVCSTIRHYRRAMPVQENFMIPNLYDVAMYDDHILSPFHRSNRHNYRYHITVLGNGTIELSFKPRFMKNTQLISGKALVDYWSGRIIETELEGEFDMIKFHTQTIQGDEGASSLLPKSCHTNISFNLLGNHINSVFEAYYDCPTTLPDTVDIKGDRELMATLRPHPLEEADLEIFRQYDIDNPPAIPDTTQIDTTETEKKSVNFVRALWKIGDQLVRSIGKETDNGYIELSPLINPQYLSYSRSKGLAYKMKIWGKYAFNAHRYFETWPQFGYNFKQRQFYFTLPLRFNYNPKRDGYVEVVYGNGNRISHPSIAEEVIHEHGDTLQVDDMGLTDFKDNHLSVSNNIMLFDWIDIETGFIIHRRKAISPQAMHMMGKPDEYRSFAPKMSVKLRPWQQGPVFTVNYERAIKGINGSDIEYGQWELDAAAKHHMNRLRLINFRVGGGFYTSKRQNYFVDFSNFRDNNLPEGWDDDWTGNFQLLDSRWYNTSKYYLRNHISYESPLLIATGLPIVGHFIERERVYLSTLSIEHTRLYNEVGYGFTCRLFSVGVFASFLNTEFQRWEAKFTFELFRRW